MFLCDIFEFLCVCVCTYVCRTFTVEDIISINSELLQLLIFFKEAHFFRKTWHFEVMIVNLNQEFMA